MTMNKRNPHMDPRSGDRFVSATGREIVVLNGRYRGGVLCSTSFCGEETGIQLFRWPQQWHRRIHEFRVETK